MFNPPNRGELRTIITVDRVTKTPDGKGAFTEVWANVFGAGITARCKWINAHGTDAEENNRYGLNKKVTLIIPYSPLITETCRIKKGVEIWEVESIDDVGNLHVWYEIKLKRVGASI